MPKASQYPSSAIMMKEAADPNRRPRTTSEGTPLGQGRRVVNPGVSGSPLSPSPGSYIRQVLGQFLNLGTVNLGFNSFFSNLSSESAGSSNSIDDAEYVPEGGSNRRHGSQQAAYEQPAPATIIEESSAESWVR